MSMCRPWHKCGRGCSPSTIWVLAIKPMWPALVARDFSWSSVL